LAQHLVAALLEDESPRDFIKRVGKNRLPTIEQVSFKIYMEPADTFGLEGSFCDAKDVEWVKKELEDGNDWAWCRIKLVASWWNRKTYKTYEGTDYLSGCSYRSEEDFKQPGGYYDYMKAVAYGELIDNIENDREAKEEED
jgi:hypothetical protein